MSPSSCAQRDNKYLATLQGRHCDNRRVAATQSEVKQLPRSATGSCARSACTTRPARDKSSDLRPQRFELLAVEQRAGREPIGMRRHVIGIAKVTDDVEVIAACFVE